MALAGDVREAERSTRALKPGRGRTESEPETAAAPDSEEARPIRAAHRPVRRPHRRRPRVPAVPGRRGPAPHRLGRAGPGQPAHGQGAAARRRRRRRRPGRPGPGQAAHDPAALAVRRRPAHRGRGRAAPAHRAGPRVPRPARRRPARVRLRRLVGRGRLGRLGPDGRAGPAPLARARQPCSRSWSACPPARSTWPASPALPGPGRPPLAVDAGRRRPGRVAPGPLVDRPGPPGHAGRHRHPGPHVPDRRPGSPSPAPPPPWSRPPPPCPAPSPRLPSLAAAN